MAKKLTSTKAKKILHDKTVHGKPLTDKQRKFFGAVASGAIPQAQNGIEGTMSGLTDIGFNYNGAWGGTMQDGGYIDSVLNANKNLDWVQRLYEKNTPSIKIPGQKGRSTHFMESADGRVYPTVVRMPNGKLKYLADKAYDYADSTKTYIQFPSDEAAQQFGKNYKKGTGVLKDFAMGGGLPGAVGFTYARTAGAAPANGPYAKKTKASAQKGKAITKREDFEPWWNWASRKAGDVDKRQDAFGKLGDLYAYYAGQPLRYNVLENSEYKPTNAKDPNASYISINDPKFKQEVFDKYNDVFIKKELGKGKLQAQKINDNTYSVSGYTPATRKQFEEAKKLGTHPVYMKGKDYVSNAIGRYFISKGKDEKGDYISYYDTFDEGSGPDGGGIGETLKLTKPFEIYDRIYLDPKTGKPKMQNGGGVEYKELPEIVVVGGKDKPTVDLYRKELDKLKSSENNPYTGAEAYAKYYAKMQMAKNFGVPKIRPAKPIGSVGSFFRNRSGVSSDPNEPWPQYSPFSKTVYAGFSDNDNYKKEYIPELSHYVSQTKRKEWLGKNNYAKALLSDLWEYAKGNDPYIVEGTEENFAHSQVEPALRESYHKFKKEGRDKFMESAHNSMKRKLYEKSKKLQNGGEMKFYQAGLDFRPKTISQDGSIISPLGQWAYPGEVTTIPSNQITMQGVPYPVLGISDVGDVQMMYPGEDYTFDGEYVTEYPMAKGGISVNEADAQPIKKLDQLLNFTNYNDMAKAKKGKKLPKAQFGIPSEYNLNLAKYDPNTQMFNSPTGRISKFDTMNQGFTNSGTNTGVFNSLSSVNNALGDMGGIGGASSQLLGGIQLLMEEQRQKKKTKQFAALSDVAGKAATTRPVGLERKYVRPEDMLVEPGQIGSPYGTGMDFLQMEDGGFIGGNPTEIQNMYNPGNLYSDLGYEPLEDSTKVKQFKKGGKAQFGTVQAGQIGSTLGSFLGGGGGQQSGAGQIGGAVGGVAGNLLLPGVGGAIGSALGGVIGGAIGGQSQKKMEQMNRQAQGNLGVAALQQSLQGQFSGFMEHGGELKYLSHTWQPQTITKFGEYDVKDLLAPPKDADMLRAGGHLKEYTAPSEAAMSTERPAMQMGGELQTYWGGYAEPISYNPYLPDGGETVMFRGQSHDESDGKGRTGIGITYGNSPVEVERGEPAVKLKDGGTGEDSLVVFGNMKIPSYGASELGDPKAKGMKFKRYAEDLSKIETKANKTSDKAQSILENTDGSSPFDMLSMSTANAMMKGSDMKLKEAAMKKQLAAGIQSAILDTAEEMGIENDALAKGKIKAAKGGGKFTSAQVGINQPLTPILPVNTYYQVPVRQTDSLLQTTPAVQELINKQKAAAQKPASKAKAKAAPVKEQVKRELMKLDFEPRDVSDMSAIPSGVLQKDLSLSTPGIEKLKTFKAQQPTEEKFNLLDLANQLAPYTRPLMRNPLDPGQLAPEMMALATNVVEPVQAQQFRPLLEETPTVSFQDQLNEIQAEANAARRLAGNNPAAQSAIAAQAAAAKNKVLAEQLRTNQALQLESRRRNLSTLNDATLKNLAILDQQFTRQAQARSATKGQAQAALQSIADKIARNKAETLQANVMSNMYPQYTFGPKGRIFNTGLTTFNIPTIASSTDAKAARNGSIVKAIKNL